MLSLAGQRVLGFCVIVGGIIAIFLGVTKPNPFKETTTYYADFNSAQGLGPVGRDIRIAGVNSGTLTGVERIGDDARITLELNGDVELHRDARADMRPHTLFEGSSFVDLHTGSPTAPVLEPGGTIPVSQTTNYVTLDEALRVLRPEIRDSLRDLAEVGSKTLKGGAIRGIQQTLKNGPELTKNLHGPVRDAQGTHRVELTRAIAGMSETVDAVADREDDLIPLNQRLNRTAAALAIDGGVPLDRALAALPGALRELDAAAPSLTALVDRLDTFGVAVTPALPDLAAALHEGTPLLRRTIPLLRRTTPLIEDIGKVGKRVAAASPAIASLVADIGPVADTLGGSVLPTLLSPSREGAPTYEQLLATFTAADAVFRPYQTDNGSTPQNPLGEGHLWQIGTYGDSGTALGIPSPARCASIAAVDAEAAKQLKAAGYGC